MAAHNVDDVNFCIRCGFSLKIAESAGGLRPICPKCGWIFFADPKVAVAALIEQAGKVLLVRRANNPKRGMWTLPAGFIDAGEDPKRALERECLEETGLVVAVDSLVDVIYGLEHARGAHILIVYRAHVISGQTRPCDDVDQVGFFGYNELPELAFSATQIILSGRA